MCVHVCVGDQMPQNSFANILPKPSTCTVQPPADTLSAVFQPINPLAASQALAAKSKASAAKVTTVPLPYLTLPYGEDVLLPSAEASNGPKVHPWINHKVTKSSSSVLTWVHTNTWNHPRPKWGPTHLDLPTNTHSQYLQENVSLKAHKHIHPGHYDQQNSKPGKSRRPIPKSSIKPQNPQVQHSLGSTPKLESHQPGFNDQQNALQ